MANDQTRNLNAHKAATFARIYWGNAYSKQRGGTMDFWDTLNGSEKRFCRDAVKAINASRNERNRRPDA